MGPGEGHGTYTLSDSKEEEEGMGAVSVLPCLFQKMTGVFLWCGSYCSLETSVAHWSARHSWGEQIPGSCPTSNQTSPHWDFLLVLSQRISKGMKKHRSALRRLCFLALESASSWPSGEMQSFNAEPKMEFFKQVPRAHGGSLALSTRWHGILVQCKSSDLDKWNPSTEPVGVVRKVGGGS